MAAKVFGGILWGMVADRWKCHRLICISTCFLSILCLIGQLGAALTLADERTSSCKFDLAETNSMENMTTPTSLKNLTSSEISDFPTQGSINHTRAANPPTTAPTIMISSKTIGDSLQPSEKKEKFGTLFIVILFLSVLNLFCDCHLAFLDTGTIRKIQMNSVKMNLRKVNYGSQRLFSPLGATFGNLVANLSIQYFPKSRVSCFTGMFICYTVFLLLLCSSILIIYQGLSFKEESQDKDTEEDGEDLIGDKTKPSEDKDILGEKMNMDKSSSISDKNIAEPYDDEKSNNLNKIEDDNVSYRKLFFKILFRNDIIFLLISTGLSGMVYSPMLSFHYLLLKDLNASAITYTIITAAGGIGATLAYKFSNKILKMFTPFRSLGACYVIAAFIQIGYGLADTAWVPVSLRPLFGFVHCLSLAGGLHYLKDKCPVDVLTSIISLYLALFYGVGPGIGLVVSGEVYGAYGGRTLFCAVAIVSFSWSVVVGLYCIHYFRSNSSLKK